MSENQFHSVNAFVIRNFLIGCGFGFLLLVVICGWISWKESKRNLEHLQLEMESDLRKTAFAIDRETRNFWNLSLYIARLIEREHDSLETWHVEDAESRFLDFINHFSDVTYFSIELNNPAQSWGWERSLSHPDEWALLLDYHRSLEKEGDTGAKDDATASVPLTHNQFKLVTSAENPKVYSQVEAVLKSGENGQEKVGRIVLRRPWEDIFLNSGDEKFFLVDAQGTVWRPIYQSMVSSSGQNQDPQHQRISLWTREEEYFEKELETSWDELWHLPREERMSLNGNSLFIHPAIQLKDQPVWWIAAKLTKDEIRQKLTWTQQPMIWIVLGATPVLGLCWLGLVQSSNLNASISEIKRIQQEKQSLIHRIHLATKAANIGVWIFDLRTGYLEWDETMFKVFDIQPEEFHHRFEDWKKRLHPEDIARALEEVTLTFQGKESLQTKFRIITSQGEVRHICAFAEAERDKDQIPIRVIGVNWDITEEKQVRKELTQAKVAAENASRAKGAFLANMSHEIRTPMNGVMGMTNLLLQTELNQEQKECLEIIQKSGESLLGLVNDILDFSKIESGQLKLEIVAFQPAKVVADALSLLAPLAYQKGLEMEYFIDSQIPDVFWGDETRIRQILINLVGNAIKFTPMGQVTVTCAVSQSGNETHPGIEVCVQDSGIGIEQHQIPKLFELFTQLDVSTTRKFGGTGLGLSISKNLVEKMGGSIWVESEVGHGSKFYFTLPRIDISEEDRKKSGHAFLDEDFAADLSSIQTSLNDQVVLWIEPNEMVRRRISVLADRLGLTIQTCETFQQAMERSKSQYFGKNSSLKTGPIVVNALIPGSSGLDTVRELSKSEIFRNSPFLMTCYGPSSSISNSDLISGVIQKPLRPATVIAVLKRVLGLQRKDVPSMVESGIDVELSVHDHEKNDLHHEELPGIELIGLIADDNPVNQRVCQFMMKRFGLRVDSAYDGAEAVRLWQKRKYAFILMDIHMPTLDGYEATKRILQLAKEQEEKAPCIIALSAAISESEKLKSQEAGMQVFLEKPLKSEELRRVLSNVGAIAG